MTVGERIKSSRIAKGATQEELAKVLGTTKQTIYKYENNIVKRELPCDFINDPIKYKHLKEEYLRKRGKNETHS